MKIRFLIIPLLLATGLFSCKKDDFNYPEGTVGSSKIVYFPLISTNGEKVVAIEEGNDYTDPGATASLNGVTAEYTTSQTITSSTAPGVYTITYTAANEQGFTATDWRMVVVTPSSVISDPVVGANDFSGTYLRAATGVTSTWTKIGTGVYTVENPGGSSGVGLLVVAVNYSGNTISIPEQTAPDFGGSVSSTEVTYAPGHFMRLVMEPVQELL
jgi:hypothetical protein